MTISANLKTNVNFVEHLSQDEIFEILVYRAHAIQFEIMQEPPIWIDLETFDDETFIQQTDSILSGQGFNVTPDQVTDVLVPIYHAHFKQQVFDWIHTQKQAQFAWQTVDLFDV